MDIFEEGNGNQMSRLEVRFWQQGTWLGCWQ